MEVSLLPTEQKGKIVSNQPKISIVIVNYNTGKQLENCLESIHRSPCHVLDKVVVIDNDSKDGSADFLKQQDKIILISNQENLGFGKACNQGAALISADYVLFLNPDTIISSDAMLALVGRLSAADNKKIAVCGLKQVDQNNNVSRHCCDFPNLTNFLSRSVGITSIFPRLGHVLGNWDHLNSREVNHVIGSCYAIRRDVFEGLNGFDERFFLYYEDLDLSKRVAMAGWSIHYHADHHLQHFCGGSSKKVPVVRLFRSLQSKIIYADKHLGATQAYLLLTVNVLFELPIRCLLCILSLSPSNLKSTIFAFTLLLNWFIRVGLARDKN